MDLDPGARRDRILLVDDDTAVLDLLVRVLQRDHDLVIARTAADALRLARLGQPDLVLLDLELPDGSGLDVCRALRAHPALGDVAVVLLTRHDDERTEIAGFEAGAADFLVKPPRAAVVLARIRTHIRAKRMAEELRALALVDPTTGIGNRRRFDDALALEVLRSQRTSTPVGLAMIDVDHFKAYNDRYGHAAGDTALHAMAQAAASSVRRPADLVCRYGGEELVALLPGTEISGALAMAERIRAAVAALGIPHVGSGPDDLLTVSIGVAAAVPTGLSGGRSVTAAANALVRSADAALYRAKRDGRDRCVAAAEPVQLLGLSD